MQIYKNKTKLMTTVTIVLLIASMIMITNTPVNAQLSTTQPVSGPLPTGATVSATVEIRPFLSFRPNPVGLNQPILVNMYVTPAPGAGRKLLDYKVTITKPNGDTYIHTTDSRWDDGTAWFEYTVDQVGEWTLKFEFPGTYLPAGRYFEGNIITASTGGTVYTEAAYYSPVSTQEQKLTVQQDMVASWPPAALPTDYWTRPISMMNREWAAIAGNYPWPYGNAGYDYAGPFVIGPESAHVVWKRQGGIFGLVGAEMGQFSLDPTAVIGAAGGGNPTVIYAGRAYETFTKPGFGSTAICYDLRTGEMFYEIPGGVTPQYISYTETSVELLAISGGRLLKINPWTGLVASNISLSPLSSGTFYNSVYFLTVQDLGAAAANATGGRYRLINWTSVGTSTNFTTRIQNNITWPWSSLGTVQDFNAGAAVLISGITRAGSYVGQIVTSASLTSGAILWNTTIEEPYYSGSCNVADNGKVAVHNDRGYFRCFDIISGQELWKGEQFEYPWDAPGFGAYDIASAYGLIFRSAYTGLYAVNWTTGKIQWKYESPNNPYETPYVTENGTAVSSWNGGILVADGKVYDYNTEHSPTQPITRGWKLHCVNATTGEGIWNITAMSGSRDFRGAIADGYLAFDNFYDGFMYVFGKGKSATTVTASPKTAVEGAPVLIEGTVLDLSPAQPNTPCVSQDSISTQMEFLHMQMPIDGIWHDIQMTGVPVMLTAINSKGEYIDIGEVTTNAYYGTFQKAWMPPADDTYEIIASFGGDASYGNSAASTAVSVSVAPEVPDTNNNPVETDALSPSEFYTAIALATVAIIVAIAAIGLLLLRKR